MSAFLRRDTNLHNTEVAPFQHKYLIRRPAFQTQSNDSRSISLHNTRSRNGEPFNADPTNTDGTGPVDNPMVEKRRLELFIDLIWVGIIGNLAEHFSEQSFTNESHSTVGEALGELIIVFLIAIRMWKNLQEFMTKYQTNDAVEWIFVIWYLILAMFYGNNAPYLINSPEPSNTAIVVYLISKGSLLAIEFAYSLFLPVKKREILIRLMLIGWPTIPFFVAACFVGYHLKIALLTTAMVLEFVLASLIETPLFENILREERARPWDADHWIERLQDFFIIILGEGVLNLIRGSPLGVGLTRESGAGVIVLCIYYMISNFFFDGDGSRTYVHAVRRTFWRKTAFVFFHTAMFLSTLTLEVSAVFLIQHPTANAIRPQHPEGEAEPENSEEMSDLATYIYTAKWSVATSLTFTMLCLTTIALSNRSLDRPGSLMITNRYLRLAPRVALIVIALCLPIQRAMESLTFLGILAAVLLFVRLWEVIASLEHAGGIIEP